MKNSFKFYKNCKNKFLTPKVGVYFALSTGKANYSFVEELTDQKQTFFFLNREKLFRSESSRIGRIGYFCVVKPRPSRVLKSIVVIKWKATRSLWLEIYIYIFVQFVGCKMILLRNGVRMKSLQNRIIHKIILLHFYRSACVCFYKYYKTLFCCCFNLM